MMNRRILISRSNIGDKESSASHHTVIMSRVKIVYKADKIENLPSVDGMEDKNFLKFFFVLCDLLNQIFNRG